MDIDPKLVNSNAGQADDRALSMLTGFGYDISRHIACLVDGCTVRFTNDYLLAQHVELTHGWQIDDVNEAIAEKEALEGGKFWIGGGEPLDEADKALKRRLLEEALL